MEESFIITIGYKGQELKLDTVFIHTAYMHKFKVSIDGIEVFFEPDEEGHYRAVLPYDLDEKTRSQIDPALIQAIAETLAEA